MFALLRKKGRRLGRAWLGGVRGLIGGRGVDIGDIGSPLLVEA